MSGAVPTPWTRADLGHLDAPVRPGATESDRTTPGAPMDDVTLLRKLIEEHARELYRTDDLYGAPIDDDDAEKLAARILTDHRFAALRSGS